MKISVIHIRLFKQLFISVLHGSRLQRGIAAKYIRPVLFQLSKQLNNFSCQGNGSPGTFAFGGSLQQKGSGHAALHSNSLYRAVYSHRHILEINVRPFKRA